MGIGADATQKAFYSTDINSFLARPGIDIPRHFYEANLAENTNHVLVAVDPAGGGASAFAISSVVQLPTGGIVVRGQLPSFSPCHISLSTIHVFTNATGDWHECFTNLGITNGSTRSAMSCANASPPRAAKCLRTSGSWCRANRSAARLHVTSGAMRPSFAMLASSSLACACATVSPYTAGSSVHTPYKWLLNTSGVGSTSRWLRGGPSINDLSSS